MSAIDTFGDVRRSLHERLLRRVDARELDRVSGAERRMRVREEALAVLREDGHILPQGALAKVVNEVSDAVVGMGPIEFLLKDPDVTDFTLPNVPSRVTVAPQARGGNPWLRSSRFERRSMPASARTTRASA